jgi:co-chaperonin GroES (HSP10)
MIRPRNDNIYIKFDKPIEQAKKIFLPDDHRERTRLGTVIAVGDEVKYFKEGDRVIASYFAGVPLELPQYDLDPVIDRIVTQSELIAFIDEAEGEE